eukprot:COSAG06_NODE_5741_length_3297_cov_8.875235_6_plen_84_part_00
MPGAPPPSVWLAGEDAVAEHALGVTTRPPRDRIWLARTASRTVYANAALACRPPSGSEKPDTVLLHWLWRWSSRCASAVPAQR